MSKTNEQSAGPCPVMRACGGCTWLGLPYKKQLARKQAAMEGLFLPLFERLKWKLELDPIVGMGKTDANGRLKSPRAFRYKAATPFAPGPHGQVRCGFYAHGTHRIVDSATCPVEAPGAREILNQVAHTAEELHIPAYNEDTGQGILRYAVLRLGWRTDEGMLTLVTAQRNLPRCRELVKRLRAANPRLTTIAQNINPRRTNAILDSETCILAGPPRMRDQLLDCTFEVSPTAFYQTNPAQTEVLYQLAIDGMDLHQGDVLIDAYCGSGTIGICAVRDALNAGTQVQLLGVERNPGSIEDAWQNARLNNLSECSTFKAQDATEYLLRAAARGKHADVVVMDPPRAGSTQEFLSAAATMEPRTIVYVSCNPQTQARDLVYLAQAGYVLTQLTPVDMFPHTLHVETVSLLTRSSTMHPYIGVSIDVSELDGFKKKPAGATYAQIRE